MHSRELKYCFGELDKELDSYSFCICVTCVNSNVCEYCVVCSLAQEDHPGEECNFRKPRQECDGYERAALLSFWSDKLIISDIRKVMNDKEDSNSGGL